MPLLVILYFILLVLIYFKISNNIVISFLFEGPLLHLTHIYAISINYPPSVFRAIGSMCPSLKEIYICSHYTKEERELHFTFGNDEVEISAETLEATLMDWPKVTSILKLYIR